MPLNRRLILIFYKPLAILNGSLTVFSVYFISQAGWYSQNIGSNNVVITTFLKIFGYAASFGYQYLMLQNVYNYYRNAGVSIQKMYLIVLMFDFSVYVLLLLLYKLIS